MTRAIVAAVLAALVWFPAASFAQAPAPASVEVEPVRCWWRTDRASIRMGAPFDAVLTCAALETPSTRVVVDRSRLDFTVMSLPPFDVLDGTASEDAVTPARRFFQYTYQLRLLNDTAFGQDVRLAGPPIGYRIDTQTGDGTTSQGRDLTYALPPLTMRVLSLVAGDSRDIRDSTSLTFADLDARRFRARVLNILGWVFYALAAGVVLLAAVRAYAALRAPARVTLNLVSGRAILATAGRELANVQRERQTDGWTDALVARAAAALRVIAGYAVGRPAAQAPGLAASAVGGQLALTRGLLRRRHALVSASVTPADLGDAGTSSGAVQAVRDGLTAITAARFGRAALDDSAVDGAMRAGSDLARRLALRHSWPMVRWARFLALISEWRGRA
jgi:hypothetical protein